MAMAIVAFYSVCMGLGLVLCVFFVVIPPLDGLGTDRIGLMMGVGRKGESMKYPWEICVR